MPTDGTERLAQVSHVPERDHVVAAAGDHHSSIPGNRQSADSALELGRCPPAFLGIFYVPDANGFVPAAAHKPFSTGRKGDSDYGIGMSPIGAENVPGVDFEKLNFPVAASDCGDPSVGGKAHGSGLREARVRWGRLLRVGAKVPPGGGSVGGRREHPFAVTSEGH